MIKCENLEYMSRLAEEGRLHTTEGVLDYRHAIGGCHLNCGGVIEECRQKVLYFLNKSGSHVSFEYNSKK